MLIHFEYSPWWLLLVTVVSVTFAYLLYSRKAPWNTLSNILLAVFRGSIFWILGFLLLNPYVRYVKNTTQAPLWVLAVDNSQSIALVWDSAKIEEEKQALARVENALSQQGFQPVLLGYEGTLANAQALQMKERSSPIDALLQSIKKEYPSAPIAAATLISDGLYNQGLAPSFRTFSFPVHSLLWGDTSVRKDVFIADMQYNRVVYQGNRFPLSVKVQHQALGGQTIQLSLSENGKTLQSQSLTLKAGQVINTHTFIVEAETAGLRKFTVQISPLAGEFNTDNNTQTAFIEVVEGKQKILLVAPSPHPDIRALKRAIEVNQNYEVQVYIPKLSPVPKDGTFDLLICYQYPSGAPDNFVDKLIASQMPIWWFYGGQTDSRRFNTVQNVLKIQPQAYETDEAMAHFQLEQTYFTFSEEHIRLLESFPPLAVPYGALEILPTGDKPLLAQKIGQVVTSRPLLVFSQAGDNKSAVFMGENIWKWRVDEYQQTQSSEAFDTFILKIAQYLATKTDTRKFRVNTSKKEYLQGEKVVFETEVYNDLFERIDGQPIQLSINGNGLSKAYTYSSRASGGAYTVTELPEGIYQFEASTALEGRTEVAKGQFSILNRAIESYALQADTLLLKNIAQNNKGKLFYDSEALIREIENTEAQSVIYSEKTVQELIQLHWILYLLIALLTLEWGLRKYWGGY
ncbi:hypothetical protein QWY31_04885 [Cytophagales bacterium LB-30]|uniref:VWA domain-containing protein n=1 Tax=Shiella aurantiaca TaxID=3058365 RepID=A0ABT8F383_9BACT|nr:hypothetical protein [Shiella aurantiaca]MDN4164824.1 hypothetical protein [Shiella aurantiaca]